MIILWSYLRHQFYDSSADCIILGVLFGLATFIALILGFIVVVLLINKYNKVRVCELYDVEHV